MSKKKNQPDNHGYDENCKVETFEQAKSIMKTRLKYLRVDLGIHSSVEDSLITEFRMICEDKNRNLMDYYTHFYAPCKVSSPEPVICGQGDMNDTMIDFSEGYDKFIKALGEEYANHIIRRRNASILLTKLLSLNHLQTRILYYYYYKAMDEKMIIDLMFISRSTFYRIKNNGLTMLTAIFYPQLYEQHKKKKK